LAFAPTPLRLSVPIMQCMAQGSLAMEKMFGFHPAQIELIKENKHFPTSQNAPVWLAFDVRLQFWIRPEWETITASLQAPSNGSSPLFFQLLVPCRKPALPIPC